MRFCVSVFLLLTFAVSCIRPWQGRRLKSESENSANLRIENETVQFEKVESLDAKTWQARAFMQLGFCLNLRNRPTEKEAPSPTIEIRVLKDKSNIPEWKSVALGASNCVHIPESVDFPYASKYPGYFKWTLNVRAQDAKEDSAISSAFYINPWQQSAMINPSIDPVTSGQPPTPLQMQINSIALGRSSEPTLKIDPSLSLVFQYPLSLKMDPLFTRTAGGHASSFNRVFGEGARYRVKGSLTAQNKTLGRFEVEWTTNSQGHLVGDVNVPIRFEDLPQLEDRPLLNLNLTPLSTGDTSPESHSFFAVLDLNSREQFIPTFPQSLETSEPVKEGQDEKIEKVLPPEDRWVEALGLRDVQKFDVNQETDLVLSPEINLPANEARGALYNKTLDPAWLYRFSYLYSKTPLPFPGLDDSRSDVEHFHQHPEKFVDWFRFTVVQSVEETPVSSDLDSNSLNVEAGVFKEARESSRAIDGKSAASGVERGENRTVGVNAIGSGHSWFWSYEGGEKHYTQQESSNHRDRILEGGFRRNSRVYINTLTVSLKGTFKRCMLLLFKPGRSESTSPGHFLFCGPVDKGQKSESYFYISSERLDSPLSFLTGKVPSSAPKYLRAFRGESNLIRLQKAMRDSTLAMDVRPAAFWKSSDSDNETFFDKYKEIASFPGVFEIEHFPEDNPRAVRLQILVNDLGKALDGANAAIHPSELLAYFTLVQAQPAKLLREAEGPSGFARLGELITARDTETCRLYLSVLSELHLTMSSDQKTTEAQWLYNLAARLAPNCQQRPRS